MLMAAHPCICIHWIVNKNQRKYIQGYMLPVCNEGLPVEINEP